MTQILNLVLWTCSCRTLQLEKEHQAQLQASLTNCAEYMALSTPGIRAASTELASLEREAAPTLTISPELC